MSVVTVYAVFADPAEAQRIGRQMVEEGHAACVNLLQPCRSFYRWEGAIETANETPALFKTTLDKADGIIARIAELHSYSVPAIAFGRSSGCTKAMPTGSKPSFAADPVLFYPSGIACFCLTFDPLASISAADGVARSGAS